MINEISFETHITQEEFTKFNYYAFYSIPIGIITTIIGGLMWFVILGYFLNPALTFDKFPIVQLIFALIMTVFLPLLTYWNSKKNYSSKSRITEKMSYKIDKNWIEIKAESFESKLTWEKIHKVKETKSWFLIYYSKVVSYVIIKNDLNEEQIMDFRSLMKSIPNLKYKLR